MPIIKWQYRQGRIDGDRIKSLPQKGWKKLNLSDSWGGDRIDVLFRSEIIVPNEFDGLSVYMDICLGAEALLFVNGKAVLGISPLHKEHLLWQRATAGKKIDFLLEAHSGWNHPRWARPHEWNGGFHIFEKCEIYCIDSRIDRICHWVEIISELVEADMISRGKAEDFLSLLNGLPTSCCSQDKIFLETYKTLEEYFAGLNVTFEKPVKYCGHSHLDIAYLWAKDETVRKNARTLLNTCRKINEYKDFKFTCSQAYLYDKMKRNYPEIFKMIKKAVATGKLEPVGGMWVEADMNLVCGESIVRQILYGKKFFREEFDTDSQIMWLPDVFGFGKILPQIMKLSGFKYFFTAKLNFAYPKLFPFNIFKWRSSDGSEIVGYLLAEHYNDDLTLPKIKRWLEHYNPPHKDDAMLFLYGHGDGGQGVTREMLEKAKVIRSISGKKCFEPVTVGKFAEDIDLKGIPVWTDEIYFNAHQGTYTTSALNKKYNRRAEEQLKKLELLAVLAAKPGICTKLEALWKQILTEQFHDILPGTCIDKAYNDSLRVYNSFFEKMESLLSQIYNDIFPETNPENIVFFNPLSFSRTDYAVVRDHDNFLKDKVKSGMRLIDEDGKTRDIQLSDNNILIDISGLSEFKATTWRFTTKKSSGSGNKPFNMTSKSIETPFYEVKFNEIGELISLFSLDLQREMLSAPSNKFLIFADEDSFFSAWDIFPDYNNHIVNNWQQVKWQIAETGPLRCTYFSEKAVSNSRIMQQIHFYRDFRRIDFETIVDWREDAKFLKVGFFPDIPADIVRTESQFGFIERKLNPETDWEKAKFEVPHYRWADISCKEFGASLMNNCKYGIDFAKNQLRLSLLRAPHFPNPRIDRGRHSFTYSFFVHPSSFEESSVVESAMELNIPVISLPGRKNENIRKIKLTGKVIIDCIKKSEIGNHWIIRLYEPYMQNGKAMLEIEGIKEVWETDLLENKLNAIPVSSGKFSFKYRKGEIKTFLIID
ncbi:MAG: glycoside hydrolase family 38 C-terminal domain-containing protein [Victivallaceae bacterium]